MEINNQSLITDCCICLLILSLFFEIRCEVGWLVCDNTLMGVYSRVYLRSFFLTPVMIIDERLLTLSTTFILLYVIVFFHVLVTTWILVTRLIHVLDSRSRSHIFRVLTLNHRHALGIHRIHSRIETFEDDIGIHALHKALVHFLHYWRWLGFNYADIVDSSWWNLYYLSVHQRLNEFRQHA